MNVPLLPHVHIFRLLFIATLFFFYYILAYPTASAHDVSLRPAGKA